MKRALVCFIITLLCMGTLCSCADKPYRRSEVVIADAIVLDVAASGRGSRAAADEMFALAEEVFGPMNINDASSTLAVFNAGAAFAQTEISEHIYNTLSLAKTAYESSGGAFDVTALPLVKLWGVDAEGLHKRRPDKFDLAATAVDGQTLPKKEDIQGTLSHVGMDKIDFFAQDGKYYLTKTDPKTQIDLGGIAKGYFTDLCVKIAEKHSLASCLINLSGNICLYGSAVGADEWRIGVVTPRPRLTLLESERGHICALTSVGTRSFVTSGDYQRFYYASYDGRTDEEDLVAVCHIIDPRSGLPVGLVYDDVGGRYTTDFSAVCSATVSGVGSALCDAYSTAVAVLGIRQGSALARENGFDALIFTNPDGGVGKFARVGDFDFIDGYDVYKSYEAVS